MRAAFSLLAPSRRSASYCSSSLTLGPWSFAIVASSSSLDKALPGGRAARNSAEGDGERRPDDGHAGGQPRHVVADVPGMELAQAREAGTDLVQRAVATDADRSHQQRAHHATRAVEVRR